MLLVVLAEDKVLAGLVEDRADAALGLDAKFWFEVKELLVAVEVADEPKAEVVVAPVARVVVERNELVPSEVLFKVELD